MAEKKERKKTPIGFAKWAHLQTPKGNKFKPNDEPKYMIDVVFPSDDPEWSAWAKDLHDRVRAMPDLENKKTNEKIKKHFPVKRELDQEDNPTGNSYVTFKTSAKFKPPVFDKYGKEFNGLIGNGSKVIVSYSEDPFSNLAAGIGIALYLNATLVKELVEYGKRTAADFAFETEPDEEAPPF